MEEFREAGLRASDWRCKPFKRKFDIKMRSDETNKNLTRLPNLTLAKSGTSSISHDGANFLSQTSSSTLAYRYKPINKKRKSLSTTVSFYKLKRKTRHS
ncbi:unnamed protein product [Moneuplotes crassus]|uniref:Uncharacterized protein n=1 Tax=Euplotes crassus TaxID=5936 RepID=A0AAD2D1S2_EUPCR|nr:unnamed protein product [Moneuplotes crassus]